MRLIERVFAEDSLIGSVTSPLTGGYASVFGGFGMLVTSILRLVFIGGGLLALFNFIVAGFQYMNAGGDSKALNSAWDKIWNSLLGLVIIVGSFALAAIVGQVLFHDALFILNPTIKGPNTP